MGHLGPRMSHPVSRKDVRSHNSGSAVRIVFSILHNERGQERHWNYINDFSERNLIVSRAIWLFWNKNGMVSSSLWLCSQLYENSFSCFLRQLFLSILLKKRDQELYENFFSCFLRNNLIWAIGSFQAIF